MSVSGKNGEKYIRHGPLICNVLLLYTILLQKTSGYCTKKCLLRFWVAQQMELEIRAVCIAVNILWIDWACHSLAEVAHACLFLASDSSSYITGASIEVAGVSHCTCTVHTYVHAPPMFQAALFCTLHVHTYYMIHTIRTSTQHLYSLYIYVLSYVWIYLYVFCQATIAATLAYLAT